MVDQNVCCVVDGKSVALDGWAVGIAGADAEVREGDVMGFRNCDWPAGYSDWVVLTVDGEVGL